MSDARLLLCNAYGNAPRSSVVVGAAPFDVSVGWLGAREEVRAYAERIRASWREFYDSDFAPWLADRLAGVGGSKLAFSVPTPPGVPQFNDPIVLGSVVGGTPAERAYVTRVENDRLAFEAYRAQLDKFNIAGPSPSQAWQALILHERALKRDREDFAPATGRTLKSKDHGPLEDEGGVSRPSPSSSIPWVPIIAVAGLFGVAAVLR